MKQYKKIKGIWDSPFIFIICLLLLIFIYFPILIIIIFSFNDSIAGVFPLRGFTFRWYIEVIKDPRFINTLKNSVYVAIATTFISGIIGIPAAYAIVRYKFMGKIGIQNMLLIPIFAPAILIGVSLATLFSFLDIKLSLLTVILGHVLTSISYFYLILRARLIGYDISIEEASRDLGASSIQTFRRISFPILWPSILGCALLVFSNSIDNFTITFFTIGADSTMPLLIWSMLRKGVAPSINAVSTILLFVIFILVAIANKFSGIKMEI